MGMQGGTNGLVGAMMYEFATLDGQTVISGLDLRGYPFRYTPGENSLHVLYNGRELSWDEYTATDGATITFPKPLAAGGRIKCWAVGTFNVADTFGRDAADARFNRRRNRFTDPGMRNSQENGTNLITLTTANFPYYVTDTCAVQLRAAAGMVTAQQIKSYTPGGSGFRVRLICTTANPGPAASDYMLASFPIEGRDIADLRFGTTGARALLKRIGVNSSVAGDIGLTIRNRLNSRSWVGKVSIQPAEVGKDVLKWVWFVGDQTGAWDDDNNLGMSLAISLCAGSNYQGVAGWQAGNFLSLSGCINFMASAGMTLDLFDVGSHDVSDITNPAPPRFELKSFGEDLRDCQRYFWQYIAVGNDYDFSFASGRYSQISYQFPVKMRINPNVTYALGDTSEAFVSGFPKFVSAPSADRMSLRTDHATTTGYTSITSIAANARMI